MKDYRPRKKNINNRILERVRFLTGSLSSLPKSIYKKKNKILYTFIGSIFSIILIIKLPTFLVTANSEILSPSEVNPSNEWGDVLLESLLEEDNNFISTLESDLVLAIDLSDPVNCTSEIDSISINAIAYSADEMQTISIGILGDILQEQTELSHEEDSFSLHSVNIQVKQNGDKWSCKDINDLVLLVNTHSQDEQEGEWRIDKAWVEVKYSEKKSVINQRSYRWQYSSDEVSEGIKADSDLKGVKVGTQLALRIQLDNTGEADSIDKQYILQYTERVDTECREDLDWKDVTATTPISYSGVSDEEITSPQTDITKSCGDGNCSGYIEGSWGSEKAIINIPYAHYTELGFTLDTLNAKPESSYCFRVAESANEESVELTGEYISYPEILFSKKLSRDFEKELKANKLPNIKTDKTNFQAMESPRFELDYFELTEVTDPYIDGVIEEERVFEGQDFKITADVSDSSGQNIEVAPKITFVGDGHTFIELPTQNTLKPGKYSLNLNVEEKDYANFPLEQDFTWGVLAINTNKATYLPGEIAKLLMTVLDDEGSTVCDADVRLEITSPSGIKYNFSNQDGTIVNSDDCGPNNVTYIPDYSTKFNNTNEIGTYEMRITAITPNGERSLTDKFKIEEQIDFEIERIGPVRIYPPSEYSMKLKIKSNVDYQGKVTEFFPNSFLINGENKPSGEISWDVDWKTGETYELSYTFDAPDISPEFYLLGPLTLGDKVISDKRIAYSESRRWQIASDEVTGEVHPSAYTLTTGFNGNFNDASYPASNAYSSDDTYASTGFSDKRNKEYATNFRGFDFSGIADGSVINSVNVYIERHTDYANGVAQWRSTVWADVTVAAALEPGVTGSIGDTQYTTSTNPTSDAYWNYSMSTLPTTAQLKGANFGIRAQIANNNNGTDLEYFIDDIYLVVDYTPPVVTIDVSGYCYQYNRSTPCGDAGPEEIKVAYNGVAQATVQGTVGETWTISGLDEPSDGDIVTVYINGEATPGERANTITKWNTGDGNITDVMLYQRHLVIGTGETAANKTLSLDEIASFDYSISSDVDIIFDVNDTSDDLTVDNLGNYSDEILMIYGGDTFEPDTVENENINTHDLEIDDTDSDGTITASGNTFNVTGDFTNDGVFTAGTSTVVMNGSAAQAIGGTTSTAFDELTISNASVDVTASTNFSAGGTITVNANTNLAPGASVVVSGGGTITGSGTIDVSSISGSDDFNTQYTITTKTLTSLMVDYTGTGSGLSDTTYGDSGNGGLTISGSISTGTQSATVGGEFIVSGTFTPSDGTIDMTGKSIANSGSLTFHNLTISASISTSASFDINAALNVGGSGVITPSAGTITMNDGSSIANTGTLEFFNLTIADSASVSSSGSFVVDTTFDVSSSAVFSPAASNIISGTGTLTGSGTANVSSATGNNDFNTQYTLSKTLANLTVDYTGIGIGLSDTTYGSSGNGGLTVSGSLTGNGGTASVGGTFNVSGTFTPTTGTITMNNSSSISNSGSLIFQGLTIADSATVSTSADFAVAGALSNGASSNFSPSGGTITMNDGSSIANTGTLAFNILEIAASAAVTSSGSFSVVSTFTVNGSATFTPAAANVISGAGTLNGTGTVEVSSASGTNDFNTQYTIAKNLNSLTVDYTGTGAGLSDTTYGSSGSGGLTISGSITGTGGTASVGGTFNVSGTFTPSAGTITMDNSSSISNSGSLIFQGLTITDSATVSTSADFAVAGALSNGASSNFSPSGGTITMNDGSSITNGGTLTFNNLTTADGASVTANTDFNVGGTLANGIGSSLTPSSGTITMTGGSISNSGTLTFTNLTVTGTTSTSSDFSVNAALNVNGGNFSPLGGTITMNDGSSIANTGTLAFNILEIAASAAVTSSGSFSVVSTFTVNGSATFTPAAANVISGAGTLNGTGTVEVSSASGTNDFNTQYTLTKTLTSLTVDYTGTGAGLSDTTYGSSGSGGLTISGSITGTGGTASVGGTFNVSGTFTPSAGTITMDNSSSISNSGSLIFQGLTIADAATVSTSADFAVAGTLSNGASSNFSPSGGTITMNDGSSITNTGTLTFNNLTTADGASVTANTDFNVAGTLSNGTGSTLTPSSGTITMTGGSISNTGTLTFNNLTVTGTTSTSSDFSVNAALNVNGGDFSPSGGTITMNDGSSITNSGTLAFSSLTIADSATVSTSADFDVAGTLSNGASSNFSPSGGTITMTGGSISNDPTGTLTFNNLTVSGTTSTSSSFSIGGTLDVSGGDLSPSGGTITMTGGSIANSGTLVFNNLTVTGTTSTSASFSIGGTLNVNGGNLSPSGGTITMNNSSSISNSGTLDFNNLTVADSATVTVNNGFEISGTTDIGTSGDLAISSGTVLHSGATLTLDGTISGAGRFTYQSSASFPTGGTISSILRFDSTNNNQTISQRTYAGVVELYSNTTLARTITLGTATGQTINFSSSLNLETANTGTLDLDADDFVTDPIVNITGDLTFTGGGGTKTIISGGSAWTVTGNVNLTNGTYTASANNTLIMNGTSKILTTAGNTLHNLTLSAGATITLAGATHSIAGNFEASGLSDHGSSTIIMTGTSNTITGGGATLNHLTINPSSSGTITLQTSDITVEGTLTVSNDDTLSIASGRTLTHTGATLTLTGSPGGTISGAGTLRFTDASGGPGTDGTISSIVRYDCSAGNIASTTIDARTYSGPVEIFSDDTAVAHRTVTLATGTYTTSGDTSHLYIINNSNSYTLTLIGETGDPTVSIDGDLDYTGTGTSSEIITSGTGDWTVSGNVNFTDGTFTATATNTFQMNGTSKSITSNSQTLQNFAVTGGGSISNVGNLDVDGTFTVSVGGFTHTAGADIDIYVAGNFTIQDDATWTENVTASSQLIFDGDLDYADNNTPDETKQSVGNVVIGLSPDTTILTSDMKANSLTVTADDYFYTCEYDIDIGNGGVEISGTFDASAAGGGSCSGNEGDETYMNTAEDFNINSGATFVQDQSTLEFDDTSGTNTLITDDVSYSLYNLIINAGTTVTIQVQDPLDVDNDVTITQGDLDTVSGESNAITVGGSWDNNYDFTANSGTVTFDSADTGETIEAGNDAFNDVVFNNSGGGWTIQTDSLTANDFTITDIDASASGFIVNNVTVEVGGTYSCADAEFAYTTWTSATLYLNSATSYEIGSEDQSAETYSTLQVGTSTDIRTWQSDASTETVDATGSLYSQDHNNVNGDLYIWGDYHVAANDYWSYATDFDGTDISGGSERQVDVRIDGSANVTVDNTFTLAAIGSSGANRTTVSNQGSGGYGITVSSGGIINFQYTQFDYLEGTTGINLQTGASVTSLDYTEYDNMVNSGTDAYITVAQNVIGAGTPTHTGLVFDDTSTFAECNVNRTGGDPAGSWTFTGHSGDIDGETYDCKDGANEDDPGKLIWDDSVANQAPTFDDPANLDQTTTGDVTIALADWVNATTVKFTANAEDPDNPDKLYLCIEVDQLGTAFSGTEDSCDAVGVDYGGTEVEVTHQITGLITGTEYHWQARVKDEGGLYSAWESYPSPTANPESERDFGVDTSNPGTGTVNDGDTIGSDEDENDGTMDTVYGNWSGFTDAQSAIKSYEYAIGTTAGGTDIVNWTSKSDIGVGHLFSDEFETGDFTEWDDEVIDSGDLDTGNDAAAYLGIWGMTATINDANPIYVQDDFTNESDYYARFYINPNNLSMNSGDTFTVVDITSTGTIRASVELNYDGSDYRVRGVLEVGPQQTSWVNIGASSWSSVEIRWFANASGYVTLWVNGGTPNNSPTGDTGGLTVNRIQIGMVSDRDSTTSGTFYIDKFTSDDTEYNGVHPYFEETIVTAGHLHTGQSYYISVRATNNSERTGSSASSNGFVVLPTFSFGISPSSVEFQELNEGNSWTDDAKTTTTTTSTNAYNGYVVTLWTTQDMTHTLNPTYKIQNYPEPNSAPTVWSGNYFGYTTDDNVLSGGTSDRFTSGGPKFAGFVTEITKSGAGDPCADHTELIHGQTPPVSGEEFNITYRITVDATHAAGSYETVIVYIATPTF